MSATTDMTIPAKKEESASPVGPWHGARALLLAVGLVNLGLSTQTLGARDPTVMQAPPLFYVQLVAGLITIALAIGLYANSNVARCLALVCVSIGAIAAAGVITTGTRAELPASKGLLLGAAGGAYLGWLLLLDARPRRLFTAVGVVLVLTGHGWLTYVFSR